MLTSTAEGTGSELRVRLSVYTGAPGAAFGAPAALGTGQWLSAPAIAAAPDGRVLVAFSDGTSQRVAERAPGGAFAPAVSVGDARDSSVTATLLTVGAGGEAVVAWARYARGDVQFATRVGRRAVRRAVPRQLPAACPRASTRSTRRGRSSPTSSTAPVGCPTSRPTPTSCSRVTAARRSRGSRASRRRSRRSLTTPLSGGAVTRAPAAAGSSPRRRCARSRSRDGTPALAWTEPGPGSSYTLHLAAEGVVERPDPAPPRVTIGAPRSRTLSEEEPLRLPVRCDRPCEVGVAADSLTSGLSDTVKLERAGTGVLSVSGAAYLAPARIGPVRLTLAYRAPGAKRAQTRTVTVRIARAASVPFPRATDVRAVRDGGSIRVSWRVAGRQSESDTYFVSGSRTRSIASEPSVAAGPCRASAAAARTACRCARAARCGS